MIEYGLLVIRGDDSGEEYVSAKDAVDAEVMARTTYSDAACFTVGREVGPWRFVNRATTALTDEVLS